LDTKLKKCRPFASWLCMLLALLLVLTAVCTVPLLSRDALAKNYTRTNDFVATVNYALLRMMGTIPEKEETEKDAVFYDELNGTWLTGSEHDQWYLDKMGYHYFFRVGEKMVTNMGIEDAIQASHMTEADGYDYMLMMDGGCYGGFAIGMVFPAMTIEQIDRIDYSYSSELLSYCNPARYVAEEMAGEDFEFVLVLPAVEKGGLLSYIGDVLFGIDSYNSYIYWAAMRALLIVWCLVLALGLVLAVISIIKRRSIGLFNRKVAALQAKLLLEIKLALFIVLFVIPFGVIISEAYWNPWQFTLSALSLQCFFLLWMGWCDICYNRTRAFRFNLISMLIRYLKNKEDMYPSQVRMMRLVRRVFIIGGVAMMFGAFLVIVGAGAWEPAVLVFGIVFIYIGAAALCIGFDRYRTVAVEMGRLIEQTRAIRAGELNVNPNRITRGDLAELAENINCIQDGLKSAVAKQTASERMKVELITNVSHDLKTPLTSMTNYVGLLQREQLDPPEANEYVAVLAQKTERLRVLISDLFDVSKATSGAMELKLEPLDIFSLTEQTLAELEERITAAGVTVRLSHPKEKAWVMGDGRKLYRVFENIIGNAVKYSLAGTRIYIDITKGSNMTCMTVKNIANYEMNFDPNEMLERFVRADQSRTAEGSGLGLSIAKSFTELQGGKLNLTVDGDMFKVTVVLCSAQPPAETAQPAQGEIRHTTFRPSEQEEALPAGQTEEPICPEEERDVLETAETAAGEDAGL